MDRQGVLEERGLPRKSGRRTGRLLRFFASAIGAIAARGVSAGIAAAQLCPGDCGGDQAVTVDELVLMVRIALEQEQVEACTAGDTNSDGRITVDEIVRAVGMALEGCPAPPEQPTLDDAFARVALQVPDFGGMFLSEDEQQLFVYLRDPQERTRAAAQQAIEQVFGAIVPPGGLQALEGRYSFLELRDWYRLLAGEVIDVPGAVATDIDEAQNRLAVHVEDAAARERVLALLPQLGVPNEAVNVLVTGPIELLAHTVQDVQSPRQGGYQISRLACNGLASGLGAGTLGFNAVRGGQNGFVTNSHVTQRFWRLDTSTACSPAPGCGCPSSGFCPAANFYQAPGFFPSEFVGPETVDPNPFLCPPPFKKPAKWCRYSDSAFATYNGSVSFDPGVLGKPQGQTVLTSSSTNLVLGIDHTAKFTIVSPPTMPYLVGLPLHKVGRTTGWTSGKIVGTCLDYFQTNPCVHPGTTVRLCQYLVGDPTLGLASFGDSGSPVFRLLDPVCNTVELYGILWGGGNFIVPPPPWNGSSVGKIFAFSPIGGVPFQASGVQSPQDLGPLAFATAPPPACTPQSTPTPTPQAGCDFVAPRMCGGHCPNPTDLCVPKPDDSGCQCVPRLSPTPTPTASSSRTSTPSSTSTPTRTASLPPTASPTVTPSARTSTPTVTPTCVGLPSGSVGWWPLDEPAGATVISDIGGLANHGVPQPGPVNNSFANGPVTIPGKVGTALYFFSGAEFVEVPPAPSFDLASADLTIDAFFAAFPPGMPGFGGLPNWSPGQTTYFAIADKLDAVGNSGYGFAVRTFATALPPNPPNGFPVSVSVDLCFLQGNTGFCAPVYSGTSLYNGGSPPFLSPPAPPWPYAGQWLHLAVAVDRVANTGTFYLNGSPLGSFTPGPGVSDNTLPVWFGQSRLARSGFEFGLDEIEIFDRALSANEIAAIAGSGGKCKTPTPSPTRPASPTPTETPPCPPGVVCTPTPTATAVATCPGAVCTATPTSTPSPRPSETPTASVSPRPSETPTVTPTGCVSPPANMIAWWPLDEPSGATTVADIGLLPANDGTPQSGPIGAGGPSAVSGNLVKTPADGAFLFLGQSTYVEVPHASEFDLANASLTIDGWTRLFGTWVAGRTKTFWFPVIDKADPATFSGYAFALEIEQNCPGCPALPAPIPPGTMSTTTIRLLFTIGNGSSFVTYLSTPVYVGSGDASIQAPLSPPGPGWMHLTVSIDRLSNVGQFYFNGAAVSTFNPVAGVNSSVPLWIGASRLYPWHTEFVLNEIEVFDAAIAPSDIQAIASAAAGKCRTPSPTPSGASPTPTNTGGCPGTVCTPTPTFSVTVRPTASPTATPAATRTSTATRVPTATHTGTPTRTGTATVTHTPTATRTASRTPTITPTGTFTGTPTLSPTRTFTLTLSPTRSATRSPTVTATASPTFTSTVSPCPDTQLCVFKIHDLDGDGTLDAGEPGLSGWTIQINSWPSGSLVTSVVTGAGGSVCTSFLAGGQSYTATEIVQGGCVQTFPNGSHQFFLECGQALNLYFLNRCPLPSPTPTNTSLATHTPTLTPTPNPCGIEFEEPGVFFCTGTCPIPGEVCAPIGAQQCGCVPASPTRTPTRTRTRTPTSTVSPSPTHSGTPTRTPTSVFPPPID